MTTAWQLAEFNVAKARGPLDGEVMVGFMDALDAINALADRSEGFVWRHQGEDGNSTSVRVLDDPDILVNLAVWTSVEALRDYVYRSEHTEFLRRRAEWFGRLDGLPPVVMWWVPAGTEPSVAEGVERLLRLRDEGPSPEAFGFRDRFGPP